MKNGNDLDQHTQPDDGLGFARGCLWALAAVAVVYGGACLAIYLWWRTLWP